jgi:hypothetical protein
MVESVEGARLIEPQNASDVLRVILRIDLGDGLHSDARVFDEAVFAP